MVRLAIIIPIYHRESLTRAILKHYSRFSKNIKCIIVYSDNKDKQVADDFNVDSVYYPNDSLVDKFNSGFQHASKYRCPVAIVGSDDIISENYFEYCIGRIKSVDCIGLLDCRLINLESRNIYYFGGYSTLRPFPSLMQFGLSYENYEIVNQKLRYESIGSGRVFSNRFLNMVEYKPFAKTSNIETDRMDESNIDLLNKHGCLIENITMGQIGCDYWNIKSGTEFNHIETFHDFYDTVDISDYQDRFWNYFALLEKRKYSKVKGLALNMVVYNEVDRLNLMYDNGFFDIFDEVVIVDQESTDGTDKIAKRCATTYLTDSHVGYCEPSRELATRFTRSRWILCLDADEELTSIFISSLPKLMSTYYDGYCCPVENLVDGKADCVIPVEYNKYRLFRRDKVKYSNIRHTNPLSVSNNICQINNISILHHRSGKEWLLDHKRFEALNAGTYVK